MSRRTSRENVFKLIYEKSVTGEFNPFTYNRILSSEEPEQKEYFTACYNGIKEKYDLLKNMITNYAKDFKAERIFKIDLSILMVAIYEMLFMDDIPNVVSINEALELSKIYSTEKSTAFINGILASVEKNKETILNDDDESKNN